MSILTKDQILSTNDKHREPIPVPEWGGDVLVRRLTAKERDAFEDSMYVTRGKKTERNLRNFRARLAAECIVDETGAKMFSREEVEALGDKSAVALTRIVKACMRLNGFEDDDVEDLTKN